MLQPALKHPALTPPALALTQRAATYGALIDSAAEALGVAISVSGSRLSAETGAEELRGYERYLSTAGHHLLLLATLADVHSDATRHLAHRMTRRQIGDATTGAWYDAASALGGAHDLIATHLTDGVARTIEANQRLLGPAAAQACRNLTEMFLDAVEGSRQLMARIQAAQKRRADRPVPTDTFRRVQLTNQAISLCVRATHVMVSVPAKRASSPRRPNKFSSVGSDQPSQQPVTKRHHGGPHDHDSHGQNSLGKAFGATGLAIGGSEIAAAGAEGLAGVSEAAAAGGLGTGLYVGGTIATGGLLVVGSIVIIGAFWVASK